MLIVYVDDIVITRDDTPRIGEPKLYLQKRSHAKDLRALRYFSVLKWQDLENESLSFNRSMSRRAYRNWYIRT